MLLNKDIVRQQIEQMKLRAPELADDLEAIELSLESETDALTLIDQEIESEANDAHLCGAIESRIAEMKERSDRIARRGKAHREIVLAIMRAAGVKKLERPMATISVVKGRESVVVADEAAVDDEYCETKVIRTVSKTKLKAAIESGKQINYATIQEGQPTLAIRRK